MTDTITLPREVVEEALEALEFAERNNGGDDCYADSITALRTALAAEQPVPTDKDSLTVQSRLDAESFREERDEARALLNGVLQDIEALRQENEPVAVFDEQMGHPVLLLGSPMLKDKQPLYTAPPALAAEQPKHPGYIIGSHWLETAYSRICAGEAEADVLRDYGWRRCAVGQRLTQFCAEAEALRRDAERYRWLRDNAAGFSGRTLDAITDAAIDAAMGDKT